MSAMRKFGFSAVLALLLAWPPPAGADPLPGALILVARPQLQHPIYARTVLVVAPFGAGQHYGFIVNRPTRFRLGDMFPGHAPSQKVADPIFVGGPFYARLLFAVVKGERKPGSGCVQMMPGLFAAFDGRAVDRIIQANPRGARFFTGFVVWRPGELAREIAWRMWYVVAPDASLVTRDPRGLWEELAAQRGGELRVTRAATGAGR
jgi:putative AlgH/UPF0301 family transcriptional regulator